MSTERSADLDAIDDEDVGGSFLPAAETVAEVRDAPPDPRRKGQRSPSDVPGDSQQARMAADVEIARGAAKDRIQRRRADSINLGEAYQTFISNELGGYFVVERTGPRILPGEELGVLQERVTVSELSSCTIEELCSRKFGGGEYRVIARTSDHGYADVPEHYFKVGGEIIPVSSTGQRWLMEKNRPPEPAKPAGMVGDVAVLLQAMQQQGQMFMQGLQEIAKAVAAKPNPVEEENRFRMRQDAERAQREWEAGQRREMQAHEERMALARIQAEEAKAKREKEVEEARAQREREADERRAERERVAAAEQAERERKARADELERQERLEAQRAAARTHRQAQTLQFRVAMAQMEHNATGGLGKNAHQAIMGRMAEVLGDAKIAQMKKALGVEDEDDSTVMDAVKDGLKDLLREKGPEMFDALTKRWLAPAPGATHPSPTDALLAEAAARVRAEGLGGTPASIPMESAPPAALPAPAAGTAAPAADAPQSPAADADVLSRLDGMARASAAATVQGFARCLALALRQMPDVEAAWDMEFIDGLSDLYAAWGRMPAQARDVFKASPAEKFPELVAQVSPEDGKMLAACLAAPGAAEWVKELEEVAPWHDEDDVG